MRRLVLAWAVPALIVLASCSSDPAPIEPKATSSAAAASARPTSTLTPPTLPKQAMSKDATGAANFVLYWVNVSNYAALTGDTDLLRSISDPACEGCNRYIDLYERTYAAGGYLRGATERLSSVETEIGEEESYVRARMSSSRGAFRASKYEPSKVTPVESVTVVFAAKQAPDSWLMTQVGLDE